MSRQRRLNSQQNLQRGLPVLVASMHLDDLIMGGSKVVQHIVGSDGGALYRYSTINTVMR